MSTPSPWEHFSMEELTCQCGCGVMSMDNPFMQKLVKARKDCGFPFNVTSGYRCPEHNSKVSKTGKEGPHTTGQAVDIKTKGDEAHKIIDAAYMAGILNPLGDDDERGGLGVKQHGTHSNRFLHLDDLADDQTAGPRPWVWSYS